MLNFGPKLERTLSEFHSSISCKYGGLCGGCPWIERPIETQRKEKLNALRGLLAPDQIHISSPGLKNLRDRADLTLKRQASAEIKLGMWSMRPGDQELVDLDSCPMMTQELENWFKEFRTRLPDIALGSVRLRVAPDGTKGVWLDFSNEDVKYLFEEKEYLLWLSSKAVVEIGQKKKPLYFENGEFGLRPRLRKEVLLRPWFQTWDRKDKTYSINGVIGGFTQSGLIANKVLVSEVMKACALGIELSEVTFWLEAFCGSGNFTYPLSQEVDQVLAFENDPVAVQSLEEGLKREKIKNVSLLRVDLKSPKQIEKLTSILSTQKNYALLADPPRSGLMKLIDLMVEGVLTPKVLVYVSCFTDSLIKDSEKLTNLGYKLQTVHLVDQFPHTPHVEWVSLWISQNS